MKRAVWAVAFLAGLAVAPVRAQVVVEFASLDASGAEPVMLKARWYVSEAQPDPSNKAGAVAMFHGCGGMYGRKGELTERSRDYAALLTQQGFHVLVVDSLRPRGEKEICTQRIGTRKITQANRRLDALASLRWLAQQPQVDARRVGLMGWSNGGSTVLSATNSRHRVVAEFDVKPAFAVAFYPGCETDLKRGYAPTAPLLILVGEADDWTAAEPCHRLAREAVGPKPEIEGYEGAYHAFDSAAPVRLRKEVPNGVNPGQGVHVGGNEQAWQRSRERLLAFLQAYRKSPALPQNTR